METTHNTEESATTQTSKKASRKLLIVLGILGLGLLLCIVGGVIAFSVLQLDFNVSAVGYSIEEVVVTDEVDELGQPVGSKDKFRPSDTIITHVTTSGTQGIIGMRWYYEDEMIFERFAKTQENQIFTYVHSNNSAVLPDGNYRVEIHTTGGTPHEVVNFTVERYEPDVVPPQPTPVGHTNEELSAFVEVPFAFDEKWTVNGEDWEINEVKIVLMDEDQFVAVVALTEMDIPQMDEDQLYDLAKPIAAYAVKEGYLEKAENLEIDGKSYDLGETIYVNLAKRESSTFIYRAEFKVTDLLEPTS